MHRFLSENGLNMTVRPTPGPEFRFDPIDWKDRDGWRLYDDLCQAMPELVESHRMDRSYREVCQALRSDKSLGSCVKIPLLEEIICYAEGKLRIIPLRTDHGVTNLELPKTVELDLCSLILPYQGNPGFVSNEINDVTIPVDRNARKCDGVPQVFCLTIDEAARWCSRSC
jgi:hypothetical protein